MSAGTTRIKISFENGDEVSHDVCPVFWWRYVGEFLVVHETTDGVTTAYPYYLRTINKITYETGESVN